MREGKKRKKMLITEGQVEVYRNSDNAKQAKKLLEELLVNPDKAITCADHTAFRSHNFDSTYCNCSLFRCHGKHDH